MKTRLKSALCLMSLAVLGLASPAACWAGSKVTLGRNVDPGALVSMDQISHATWDALLKRYVDQNGNVAYAQWKKSPQDMQALDAYLASLSTASPRGRASREAQLAFWINAYNAVTLRGILREYPTSSIRNHTAKVLGYNIWDDLLLIVGGNKYSLNQMEHEILRKMGEPRIHFAVVCASRSCPRLLNEAYVPQKLDDQLTTNARVFFANPGNFRYDPARRQFGLSSILKWYGGDFGADQGSQLRAIAPYLPTREAYDAAVKGAGSVSYLEYDWGLNDQATVRSASNR